MLRDITPDLLIDPTDFESEMTEVRNIKTYPKNIEKLSKIPRISVIESGFYDAYLKLKIWCGNIVPTEKVKRNAVCINGMWYEPSDRQDEIEKDYAKMLKDSPEHTISRWST